MNKLRRLPDILNSRNSPEQDTNPQGPATLLPGRTPSQTPRRSPSDRPNGIKPGFRTLIGLTFITALLLLPFAFSHGYLDWLRAESVDLHQFLRGELYKQSTGFAALAFVLVEVMLTARKRSRSWIGKIKIPGTMMFWRSVHIFVGVGLVALVLVHTLGANGLNFNAIFLWVFFITTLTALIGVVAETGILESTRNIFGRFPGSDRPITKGPLIRGLRAVWLVSHIFFVCIFMLMLGFHIFLAYYYQ
ncbi:MAG: hypothetical protein VKL39_00425 [Leptolyngbyaceae bacterium]|nr:hypothetical protein [Leptolyngbyaceae bacterium]